MLGVVRRRERVQALSLDGSRKQTVRTDWRSHLLVPLDRLIPPPHSPDLPPPPPTTLPLHLRSGWGDQREGLISPAALLVAGGTACMLARLTPPSPHTPRKQAATSMHPHHPTSLFLAPQKDKETKQLIYKHIINK